MRLSSSFFQKDALDLAPLLLGKILVRKFSDKNIVYKKITELEVYRGKEDLASHASKGRTQRTEVMYAAGGVIYVYLIYGLYWMFNIVTGPQDHPEAILIRSLEDISGPGRVGHFLKLDKTFYGEDLTMSSRLWIENAKKVHSKKIQTLPRVGIDYAKEWAQVHWRFKLQ